MPLTDEERAAADAELDAARAAEYSTYVATDVIFIRGARAFNVGDAVPAGHVANGIVPEDAVAKVTTKAGQAAVAKSTGNEA